MAADAWQAFNERIAWEGSVHIACDPLDASMDAPELVRLAELNAGVLAALATFGERSSAEQPDDDATAAALTRIDAKLDVLLEMFNRHLLGHMHLPPRHAVRFNARGILIQQWSPPDAGTALLVRMHFDTCAGLPLELPGRVIGTPATDGGFISFAELSDELRQGIEHAVFRQHRRQLAEARREARPTSHKHPG